MMIGVPRGGTGKAREMSEWIDCEITLPHQEPKGNGRCSEMVLVELSDGTIDKDWLINYEWVIHCKKNGGAYPVRWKDGRI